MDSRWDKVAVLGAAGKMGSGIASLLLMEMAWRGKGTLVLVDVNEAGFPGLKEYLREQVRKHAERGINRLRERYQERKDLIDNGDMIREFTDETIDRVQCVTTLEECRGAGVIFEAIIEDENIKGKVLKEVDRITGGRAWYFTNTSSIPIDVLGKAAGVEGRIVGFHFYNPPAVQKLLEIIYPRDVNDELKTAAKSFGERLGKVIVYSNDVAGFIGNGHFIREIAAACRRVDNLSKSYGEAPAICAVNSIGQELLVRPMGIFQLIDYVGIDVCVHIGKVMGRYLEGEQFVSPLLEKYLSMGIKGGQNADGSQKEGIFRYEKGKPVAVYDLAKKHYVDYSFPEEMKPQMKDHLSWKEMSRSKDKSILLEQYFKSLRDDKSNASKIAWEMIEESRDIGHRLVEEKVAEKIKDVDTVLENGFFHLYGIEAPFKSVGE